MDPAVEVTHDGERAGEIFQRFRRHVQVLDGLERHRDPVHRPPPRGSPARRLIQGLYHVKL